MAWKLGDAKEEGKAKKHRTERSKSYKSSIKNMSALILYGLTPRTITGSWILHYYLLCGKCLQKCLPYKNIDMTTALIFALNYFKNTFGNQRRYKGATWRKASNRLWKAAGTKRPHGIPLSASPELDAELQFSRQDWSHKIIFELGKNECVDEISLDDAHLLCERSFGLWKYRNSRYLPCLRYV